MTIVDKTPFNAGFLVKEGFRESFTPSEAVTASKNVVKAVSLIQQLGFLTEGEGYLRVVSSRSRNSSANHYSICVGSLTLMSFIVYAKQIVNVEFERNTLTVEDLVKLLFSEAKKAFPTGVTLTKRSLGRFCLLRLANKSLKYSGKDIATLAVSEVKSETLVGMMSSEMPVEAILDMEEIPDSWLQTILEKFA